MNQLKSLMRGKPTSLVTIIKSHDEAIPLNISQLYDMISEIRERLTKNQAKYFTYVNAVQKNNILSDDIIDEVQSLSCEINKGYSLLIQYIEKLKEMFPNDTRIYTDKDNALKNAKVLQSSWRNALITVIKHNESNKRNSQLDSLQLYSLQFDSLQPDSIGGMSYRKRKSKRRKSKRRKSKRRKS